MSNDASVLDNPIWHALSTAHAHFAEGDDLAKRYRTDIGPLSGMRDTSPEAYHSLARLLGPDDIAVLFLTDLPTPPDSLRLIRCFPMYQMICLSPPQIPDRDLTIKKLTTADVPEMIELAEATEPGPFRQRTIELGGYRGIPVDGCLASMTGQRCGLNDFTEVSAVCTWPEFRGRGYAKALVATVANGVFEQNKTPFLGVREDNTGAVRVYEKVGFKIRRSLHVTVLKRSQ
ncbi:GNAT family N-acetyltransferase [Alloacidobacterium dinghuense]|uniref:GNAT family N-acetyltransferase n=1 Tax=Alloacidobacterium dinghuense TaxID=2763107 RepID=A0A7G8BG95_9BACT|nr:GNAT family N-acetyltransferase [Alloacidobacterium dinghuense]QNI31565.1 GNAT family N-acetyltransferase [Alloacidobacterium dinghuense]